MSNDTLALIEMARAGDGGAVAVLFERIYPEVERFAERSMRRHVYGRRPWVRAVFSTADLAQEVCLRALRDLGGFRGGTEAVLQRYLSSLAKHGIIDAIRHLGADRRDGRRVQGRIEGAGPPVPASRCDPAVLAVRREQVARLERVMDSFAGRERELLRARLVARRRFGAIAARLGYASACSARKAFHVARERLVARLRDVEHHGPRVERRAS